MLDTRKHLGPFHWRPHFEGSSMEDPGPLLCNNWYDILRGCLSVKSGWKVSMGDGAPNVCKWKAHKICELKGREEKVNQQGRSFTWWSWGDGWLTANWNLSWVCGRKVCGWKVCKKVGVNLGDVSLPESTSMQPVCSHFASRTSFGQNARWLCFPLSQV